MAVLIRIDEPRRPPGALRPSWRAFFAMAFRPLYLLAAIQAVLFIALWAFGIGGTRALPGFLWHGHEMIWGYAGAIIVGFLLTAVATWTGQPPVRGGVLAGLVALWLAARVVLLAVPDSNLWGGALSVLFFVAAALLLAQPVVRTRNARNYIVPPILLAFAAANLAFHLAVAGTLAINPRLMLHVGLLIVATVIFFMGLRVIAFFTSRALQIQQVANGRAVTVVSVAAPLAMAVLVAADGPALVIAALGAAAGFINLVQLVRWWHPQVASRPLLWVLFAGYACTAIGVLLYGFAYAWWPLLTSAALHSVAVGGIGLLTLGMMTRTALGHTGRALEVPPPLGVAFWLVLIATLLRLVAALPSPLSAVALTASGLAFAAGFALFVYRFGPWLIRPRADGQPG
jgi:uncharacterized protein involved in response to NO